MGKYDDIINLPHHTSSKRLPMSMLDRAAQFSPFAALTGYDAAIKETARLTEERIELDENEQEALDVQLQIIREHLKEKPEITVTYFQQDARKAGGAYLSLTGNVKKIDDYEKCIVMMDKQKIPVENVISVDGEIFRSI